MPHPSPRALLDKHGLRAKKSWGQNFLSDESILDGIARLAVERPGEVVVELGAGLGHLTERLVAHGARVVAVERDRDMAAVLRVEMGDAVRIVEADAARAAFAELAAQAPGGGVAGRVAVAGNIPYHLTSPILFSLLDQAGDVSRAVLLVQREVAERLAAGPGTKEWGLLSVLLQQRGTVEIDRIVPRGAFHPPPRVDSAVVRIDLHGREPRDRDPARFRLLVKAGFGQRRKTLRNALQAARIAPREVVEEALRVAGVDGGRRGETLTVEEWEAIDQALGPAADAPDGFGSFSPPTGGSAQYRREPRSTTLLREESIQTRSEGAGAMTTFNGSSAVQGGYYLSKSNWEIFPVEKDGQRLPGSASEHYVRLSTAAALLLMPVLGGLMVVFLPFIGLFLTARTAVQPIVNLFHRSAQDLAATVTPGWAPGAAHFTGKRSEEKGAEQAPSRETRLEELAREIDAKRRS